MAKKEPGPDQAASWVIAASACVINTLLSGISRGTAVFYVALIEVYGVTRFEANMPFTLRNVTRNLAGPLVGILGQRYGVRIITLIGGVFATLGVALCCFSPNVVYISVFWGVFHGLGVAFANTLFQVTVNQYFLKYRATAAGIALSGACVGSFFFPVTLEFFVNTYGLNGAFLLTSGLIIHVIPAALVLTEPPWLKKPKTKDLSKSLKAVECSKDVADLNQIVPKVDFGAKKPNDTKKQSLSLGDIASASLKTDEAKGRCETDGIIASADIKPTCADNGSVNPSFVHSTIDLTEEAYREKTQSFSLSAREARTVSVSELSSVIPMSMERRQRSQTQVSVLKSLSSVCCNPMFYMISFSMATFGLLFDPLMTVIMDYINDKGLDERVGKYLISILSVGDLVGRMCFGWVTDKEFMTVGKFMVLIQLLQGISFVLMPMFYTFEVLMGLVIVYGLAAGTAIVMFPILVAKYLPNEQSLAIGCVAFFGGLVSFSATPLIGHFRDHEGSYDGMFYITGSMEILSGFLWLFEPCFLKLKKSIVSPVGSLRR